MGNQELTGLFPRAEPCAGRPESEIAVYRREPYWLHVLEYSANGNIQAVLDEYIHNLRESLGLRDASREDAAKQISEEVRTPLGLRTSSMRVDVLTADPRSIYLERQPKSLRGRFALRYGDQFGDDDRQVARAKQVQSAFNSPFWPFVLATTSVGQEGLDFHTYCHSVIHWNLPANPVDLEQREGRVHRYKCPAVCKNIASGIKKPLDVGLKDLWGYLFEQARQTRPPGSNDLIPYWIWPGEAKIERQVPALPLSRDSRQYELLRRSLVTYRLVFSQNRQEDLVDFLYTRLSADEQKEFLQSISIDLSPKKPISVSDQE